MRQKLSFFWCALSMSLVASVLLHAQSTNAVSNYHRPAEKTDMTGLWRLVKWTAYFKVAEKDKTTPFFRDYQWYLFLEDGSLKSLSSTRNSSAKEAFDALQTAPSVIRYKIEDNVLRMTRTDLPQNKENWSCSIITEERKEGDKIPVLKRGDVLMSLLNKEGKVVYVRHLRKADPTSGEAPKPVEKPKDPEPKP